ncbi:peptidase [Sphingomonas sp. Leaf17]|uniref:alpha/beta hydrolase family protein n=1 Tax=Sphingomonas sp. Leaf17 TaxID=1735683 RepID=UPI0006F66DF6|nr:S9 family peptidase [Sphingomonas sp. Leaf17]KQM68070.1 peptidase [Sphingomonas sp. Leaf17]
MTSLLFGVVGTALLLATPTAAPVAASPGETPPATDRIPVETFATLPNVTDPQLSPDGTRIAAKFNVKGEQLLVISQLFAAAGEMKPPAIVRTGKTVDVNWWRWVGNDWLAVGLGSQQTVYGTETYITRTLGVSADGRTMNKIDWEKSGLRADDVIWRAHDGSPRILLSKQTGIDTIDQFYPGVFEANLATGKMRRITVGYENVYDWYADAQGRLRMGYRLDDDTGHSTLLYRDAASGGFKTIARAGKGGDMVIPALFRADGTALATDDTDGRDALYEVSLPDLKLGKRVYGLADHDIDGIVRSASGDGLDGVVVTDRYTHTDWLDPAMKAIQAKIDAAIGSSRRARIVSRSQDGARMLIEVGAPDQAGALYYWDTAEGSMKLFAWQNPVLKGRRLSPVTTVQYTARDGTPISAVMTLPRGREAKGLPLIVLPHGGPFARDSEGYDWWVQYLAESGYAVIQPNYRGSSGFGRDFAKKGEGQWGLTMQDDLNDALTYMTKAGIADPRRACMIGASYGGYAAMRAAQRDGALYRCAVSFAGVSDLAAMRRYDSQFLYGKTRTAWLKKQAPDFRSVSPRFGAAGFAMPILLVHGKEDKRVPVKQSRLMADELKQAGKPYEYLEQPLADHHFSRGEDRLEFLTRMKAFLDRHNPA